MSRRILSFRLRPGVFFILPSLNFYFVFFLLFLSFPLFAQFNNYLQDVAAMTPNAAAMEKYSDIPVSLHTGVPNINIPVHTLKNQALSLPVSLNYHPSGIRLAETASWVGLGWSLQAGGAITRTVRAAPDEGLAIAGTYRRGWYKNNGVNLVSWDAVRSTDAVNGALDSEADVFSFNFAGYSGKFMFQQDGTPTLISEQDLKIQPFFKNYSADGALGTFDYFIITTPDGVRYYFGTPNKDEYDGSDPAVDLTWSFHQSQGPNQTGVVTAWYMTKIVSFDGNEVINLNYIHEKYAYENLGEEKGVTSEVSACAQYIGQVGDQGNQVFTEVVGARLVSITTPYESLNFQVASDVRMDLDNVTSLISVALNVSERAKALQSIQLTDAAGNCLKQFRFDEDYFLSSKDGFVLGLIQEAETNPSDVYRLRLLDFVEDYCSGTIATRSAGAKIYSFGYFDNIAQNTGTAPPGIPNTRLARRKARAVDAWGFYNGKISNDRLLPQLTWTPPTGSST